MGNKAMKNSSLQKNNSPKGISLDIWWGLQTHFKYAIHSVKKGAFARVV